MMSSNLCTQCGVAWDHHGTGCNTVSGWRWDTTMPMAVTGAMTTTVSKILGVPICPDLLSIDDMGEADGWRGQLIRGFFIVLSWIDR